MILRKKLMNGFFAVVQHEKLMIEVFLEEFKPILIESCECENRSVTHLESVFANFGSSQIRRKGQNDQFSVQHSYPKKGLRLNISLKTSSC